MRNVLAVFVFSVACSLTAGAQSSDPIGVSTGSRVRVSIDRGPPVVGSVMRLTPATLELADSRSALHVMNTSSVTSLEISRGRPVHGERLAKGALKGFLILGGAATAVILVADPGWAFVGPLVFGPPGALIGGMRANATRPEVWHPLPVSALSAPRDGGVSNASTSVDGATISDAVAKPGRGRQIAIGAAIGAVAGAVYASSNKSATPTGTKMVMIAIPAALVGAAIGAFVH